MKSSKSKIATIFSIVCLALATMVFGVFALVSVPNQTQGTLSYIQKICYVQRTDAEDKYFSSIDKAYTYSQTGDTINIFQNATLTDDLAISKNLTLSAVQNAVTLNTQSNEISISSSASLRLGGSAYALNITSSQAPAIQNNGLLTLASGANISSISTTLQTAGTSTAGIFVESGYTPSSTIQLIISGTPTVGAQVAYCQDAQDASALVDVLKLSNQSYYLYAQGNSILIAEAVVINETLQRGYSDLSSAIAESEAGNVLDVVKNVSTDTVYAIPHSLTIKTDTTAGVQVDGAFNISTGTLTLGSGTGTLTINNYVQASGGNVEADDTISITGGEIQFTENVRNIGIYNSGSGSIEIDGASISATDGFAIYNYQSGPVHIISGTITSTSSTALYNRMDGQVTIDSGTISGNYAIQNGNADSSTTGTITVGANAQLTGANVGIYNLSNSTQSVVVNGGTIEGTSVTGIYNYSNGTVTINSGEISSNNQGIRNGRIGAAYNPTAQLVVKGTNSSTIISGGTYGINNTSSRTSANGYSISIEGGTITGGTTSSSHAGIYNYRNGSINITGGNIEGYYGIYNQATSTDGDRFVVGGTSQIIGTNSGIYNAAPVPSNGNLYTIEVTGGTIQGGTASGNAGIYNSANGTISVSGGNISGYNGIQNGMDGRSTTGRVVVSGTSTEISGTYGIYNYSEASGTDNYAVEVNGGTVIGGTTANITSGQSGIYNHGDGTIYIAGGNISGGYAIQNGSSTGTPMGSVIVTQTSSSAPTLISGTFSGIYSYSSLSGENSFAVQMDNGTIQSGTDSSQGGPAIMNRGNGFVDISGGYVTGRAQGVRNGYSSSSSGKVRISGTANILATQAVYSSSISTEAIVVEGGTITTNGDSVSARAINLVSSGTAIISGGIINGGTRTGIASLGTSNVRINAGTVTGDTAGISLGTSSFLHISGSPVISSIESASSSSSINSSSSGIIVDGALNLNNNPIPLVPDPVSVGNYVVYYNDSSVAQDWGNHFALNGTTNSLYLNGTNDLSVGAANVVNTTRSIAYAQLADAAKFSRTNNTLEVMASHTTDDVTVDKITYILSDTAVTVTGNITQTASTLTLGGGSAELTLAGYVDVQGGNLTAVSNLTITGGTYGDGTTYGIYGMQNTNITISGSTISVGGEGVSISNLGTLEVTNGEFSGVVALGNIGTATISGGSFEGDLHGISTIGGTITISGSTTTAGIVGINISGDADVTINGGTIEGDDAIVADSDSTGTLTVTGGHIEGASNYGIYTDGTLETFIRGSAVVEGYYAIYNASTLSSDTQSAVTISGGRVGVSTATYGVYNSSTGKVTISGSGGTTIGASINTTYGVYNASTGTISVEGGFIYGLTSAIGYGIYNCNGTVDITAGVIQGYYGVYNGDSTSSTALLTVDDSSGTTSIGGPYPIYNQAIDVDNSQVAVSILGGTIGNTNSTYGIRNDSTGTISMYDGTVRASTSSSSARGIMNYGNGRIEIRGGTVDGYYAIQNGNSSSNTGTVLISQRSAIIPTVIGSEDSYYGIYSYANLTISGGSIYGYYAVYLYSISSNRSTFTILGGEITGENRAVWVATSYVTLFISGDTKISGGTYGIYASTGTVELGGTPTIDNIYVGSFSTSQASTGFRVQVVGSFTPVNSIELEGSSSSYVVGRYAARYISAFYSGNWASDFHLANSSYALTLYNDVYLRITNATISNSTKGIGYTDLQGAIDGADPNDVITLLADLTDDTVYEIDKNITIRGENYTSSASANPVTISGAFLVTSGTLTLGADTLSVSGNGYGLLTVDNYVQLDGGNLIVNDYIEITGGTVTIDSSSYSVGIYNSGSGTIEITSGSISGEQYGIYNASTSAESITLNADESANDYSISGGTYDIYNFATGRIVIDGHIPPDDQITIYLNNITNTVGDARIHFGSNVSGGANDNMGQIRVFFYGWDLTGTDRIVFSSDVSGLLDGASYIEYLWVGDDTAAAGWTNGEADILHTDGKYYYRWAGCFDENTWIYYWDEKKKKIRRKRAKNVKFKDKLLVWNFDKGCFDFANPLFIQRTEVADEYTEIKFSDGTKLNIVGDHAVYNADCRYFCPIVSNEAYGSPVGTKVMKYDGSIVTIVSKKTIHKKIAYTNIINKYHMNCFTNGILTSTPFNNMYKIDENMKYIPDESKKCHMLSLLDGIDKEIIEGLRLMEFPDRVLLNSPMKSGCKSFKEYIDKKLGVQKESD